MAERRGLRILADDLTGALDSAAAFATPRSPIPVLWRPAGALPTMAAIDAATREGDGAMAIHRHDRLADWLLGDTVFVKLRGRSYDAVVAMYHDQSHVPVKLLGFDVDPATGEWKALSGVNISLGLPIIRTSVDHGTAFDIAGEGIANEESLIEAIDFALELTRHHAD